jgi:uncharacterized membrane protein YjgN (DUF898 family)
MILELFGVLGLFILILVFIAEYTKRPFLGLVSSLTLLLLAFWILSDGIQYQIGYAVAGNTTHTTSILSGNTMNGSNTNYETNITNLYYEESSSNSSNTDTSTKIEITSYQYADVSWSIAVIGLKDFLGVVFILLGLFGLLSYATEMVSQKD